MSDGGLPPQQIEGQVKWFDPGKGFGFIVSDSGGPDVLLHANVLRNFGRSSVADGSRISVLTQATDRGIQALEVLDVSPPPADESGLELDGVPLEPARVKWFDKGKGFGFANVFGRAEDIFLHIEVLRRSGLAELQPGEAVSLRVVDGRRGKMAGEVLTWESGLSED